MLERDGVHPRPRIRVERALSDREVSPTKSARDREPELFQPVAGDLLELYLARGRPGLRDLVFPADRGRHLSRHNWRARVWAPALAAAGVHYFRPYDLRHTCATLLIYGGWTILDVAAHLGHADASITATKYAHVLRDAARRRGVPIEDAIAHARHGAAPVEQLAR